MAIGAQGYSIGDAIRTLLGQVLNVMYFKKWQAVDLKRRVRAAAFADALGLFQYPGAYLWVANKSGADGRDLLRLGNAVRSLSERLLLQLGRTADKRLLVCCLGGVFGFEYTLRGKCLADALLHACAHVLRRLIAFDAVPAHTHKHGGDVLHAEFDGALCTACHWTSRRRRSSRALLNGWPLFSQASIFKYASTAAANSASLQSVLSFVVSIQPPRVENPRTILSSHYRVYEISY